MSRTRVMFHFAAPSGQPVLAQIAAMVGVQKLDAVSTSSSEVTTFATPGGGFMVWRGQTLTYPPGYLESAEVALTGWGLAIPVSYGAEVRWAFDRVKAIAFHRYLIPVERTSQQSADNFTAWLTDNEPQFFDHTKQCYCFGSNISVGPDEVIDLLLTKAIQRIDALEADLRRLHASLAASQADVAAAAAASDDAQQRYDKLVETLLAQWLPRRLRLRLERAGCI